MYYYEVAPRRIVRADASVLTYHSSTLFEPGTIVAIPVGKNEQDGVVIRRTQKPSYDTKPISRTIEAVPLPDALIQTILWMADYYTTHLATVLQTVLPRNLQTKRRISAVSSDKKQRNRTHFVLNATQQKAVDDIWGIPSGTSLLRGITGSGKTAVYIELAKRTLDEGKSVIVLVPEIALTSQLIHAFSSHFEDILLTHSRMTEAQRHVAWQQALSSTKPRVIIGPRSALFMPLSQIGLVVIDEAHEPSLKQEQAPRYHASRVASILMKEHGGRLILGSATPLVSDYYLAEYQKSPIVHMDQSARKTQKPDVTIVDMTKKDQFKSHRFISDTLMKHIDSTLADKKQVLLFHNRRGTAPTTVCTECGWTANCERCHLPMTLHSDHHTLQCHLCSLKQRIPTSCPVCASVDIIHKGIGTKLIETEIRKLYPHAHTARFDGDSERGSNVDELYDKLHDGSIDIIIGTQVVAKGLDLPHLRTVGVIQADAGLSLPDFSSSERTFQLVSQVIGRVGRSDHKTTAIIQSYQPSHPAITHGLTQDYAGFYDQEIQIRKKDAFPPFTHLLKLTCIYKTESAAVKNARLVANQLKSIAPKHLQILGPTPAFYERVADTYRWQIIVKSPIRSDLVHLLEHVPASHWQTELDSMSLI